MKIMIIDDDPEQRAHLSGVLETAGYTVVTYDRTENAVQVLISEKPNLAILDVMFPENPSGGLEIVTEIRRNEAIRHLPVILLTNINKEFPIELSEKDIDPQWMPIQEFIEKPVDVAELLKTVTGLIGKPAE